MSERTVVLLVNLGTPSSTSLKAVRQFLKEFLMDKRVIQSAWLLRALLVYGLILPFRTKKTQSAYKAIWDKREGSPLWFHSQRLLKKVGVYLDIQYPNQYEVKLAMRYGGGASNLKQVVKTLNPNQKTLLIPLYPQYAVSTTESTIALYEKEAAKRKLRTYGIVRDFYDNPGFIEASVHQIQSVLQRENPQYLLFSFHGLPQLHLRAVGCQQECKAACSPVTQSNRECYRAQCIATMRAIAGQLGLKPNQYGFSFQSRLGRLPWISPYTDKIIQSLAQQGIERLAVVCPSFITDCLETEEEIQLRLKTSWFALMKNPSQARFSYIPCLNDQVKWVAGLGQIIHTNTIML